MKALLVVDVQQEYMGKYDKELITRINERIMLAHEDNELIVYVKNQRHLKSGVCSYELADGLELCSENIVYKDKSSVFDNENLLQLLHDNVVSDITIIGIDGCCCVASSAADECKAGYTVLLPCKYIGVQNSERFEKKKSLLIKQGVIFE